MHEAYIRRCFELAQGGLGHVSPNPLVGAVLVKDGRVIGEGFHARHGAPHAEADCFSKASEDTSGSTLYVNLEPCCHTKKLTPPCVPMVIAKKIARVVISNLDPNPAVAGQGVEQLRAAGIEVITGVLQAEGEVVNEVFFHRMRTGSPFVHLKSACTIDGKIALPDGRSQWITGPEARLDSHWGRLSCDAVMIGAETLRLDNPALTVRLPDHSIERMPWRLVLSANGQLPVQSQVFTDQWRERTLVITSAVAEVPLPAEQVIRLSSLSPFNFEELYQQLAKRGIHSLWLEGGAGLHSLFLQHQQVQRITLYMAPKLMGEGKPLFHHSTTDLQSILQLTSWQTSQVGSDLKLTGRLA